MEVYVILSCAGDGHFFSSQTTMGIFATAKQAEEYYKANRDKFNYRHEILLEKWRVGDPEGRWHVKDLFTKW